MKRFNGIALSVAFCSLASQAALAQTKIDTLKVQNLNEVIVKGVRAAKEAPYAVANIRKTRTQTILLLRSGIAISPFSYTGHPRLE